MGKFERFAGFQPGHFTEKTFQALRDFRIAGDTSTTFAGYNFGLTNRREPYDPS
jgi:hypothetical protein